MLLREEEVAGVEVLGVVGKLGPGDAARLQSAVARAVATGPRGVLVDLSGVHALTPESVDVLNWMTVRAPSWPRPAFAVCCVPEGLHDLLLPQVSVHQDRESALASMEDHPAGERVGIEVPCSPQGPAQARRLAAECVARQGLAPLADDLALVVSELVTNAVRYGTPPVRLAIDTTGDAVTVVVEDGAPGRPTPRDPGEEAEGGRGLLLVDLLARNHGVRPKPPGKQVWAELARPPAAPPSRGVVRAVPDGDATS